VAAPDARAQARLGSRVGRAQVPALARPNAVPRLGALRPALANGYGYPRARGYPRVAGTGVVSYPWRVASAGADMDFSMRVRVYEVDIRTDFTCCHL
jgi:hypothetical protein